MGLNFSSGYISCNFCALLYPKLQPWMTTHRSSYVIPCLHTFVQVSTSHLPSSEDSAQFSSVAQSCLTLCDSMDCSMPGFTTLHHLPELAKLMSIESVMPSNHLVLCCPLLLYSPPFLGFPILGFSLARA